MKSRPLSVSKLTSQWNARLEREGMPAEICEPKRHSWRQSTYAVVTGDEIRDETDEMPRDEQQKARGMTGIAESDRYQYWTKLTHLVHALPVNYKGRTFLIAYVETGYVLQACRAVGITRERGRGILRNLVKYVTSLEQHEEST